MTAELNLKVLQFVHIKVLGVKTTAQTQLANCYIVRARKHCQGTEYQLASHSEIIRLISVKYRWVTQKRSHFHAAQLVN